MMKLFNNVFIILIWFCLIYILFLLCIKFISILLKIFNFYFKIEFYIKMNNQIVIIKSQLIYIYIIYYIIL
jgi:hypothetical protein